MAVTCLLAAGCGDAGTIEVDYSSVQPRFTIDHRGSPRPFWWPRVTEFAVASENELVWQLEATTSKGELARELAFVYGQTPPGFGQVFPANGVPPKPLKPGRSYFIGATGPKATYRVAFALPLSPIEAEVGRPPSSAPARLALPPPDEDD